MMVTRMTDGKTVMSNVARKSKVADLAWFLTDYGACIEGAGNNKLISKGKFRLHGSECVIAPDRIEADTFILAAVITHSCISISHIVSCQVSYLIHKRSAVGYKIKQYSHDTLAVSALLGRSGDNLQSFEVTGLYPGFLTYLKPKLMALLTTCNGLSHAEEPVFDKSISHVSTTLNSSSTNESENAIAYDNDVADEALCLILISIGKTNEIVGNTVLRKTGGLPIERADSCQPIWPLVLTHKFQNNTTSMVVNFVLTAVIGALFTEKERKQIHRVGVQVDFLGRSSVHVSSVIMHLYSRCGNEHKALQFLLDPDLCRLTKPDIVSWTSLLGGCVMTLGSEWSSIFGSLLWSNLGHEKRNVELQCCCFAFLSILLNTQPVSNMHFEELINQRSFGFVSSSTCRELVTRFNVAAIVLIKWRYYSLIRFCGTVKL